MSSILLDPMTERSPRSRRVLVIIAGVVATAAILVGLLVLVQRPTFVSQVFVENRSPTDLHVEVASGPRDATMGLGVVDSHSTESYGDVVDQGEVWIVRLGDPASGTKDLRFTRSQLQHANWHIVIPASFDPAS
jgi:hypothetical protein